MAETRCLISLVVNGQRWLEEGEALFAQNAVPRVWTLAGLQDHLRLTVGSRLGYTFDSIDFVDLRWCRAKANATDGEAVQAGLAVVTTPHVMASDPGAGLALEAIESAATSGCQVVVTVGSQMTWLPLRQKLEARGDHLFELLLPPSGKVVVSTERAIDMRELARQHHGDEKAKALFKPLPVVIKKPGAGSAEPVAGGESLAGNAVPGTVKSLANGYGMAKRKDGLPDVQFMANQVTAPGFDFLEVGDELRFDVAQVASGKWFAQRVVRM